jgi:phenylacetate-CoA ligase
MTAIRATMREIIENAPNWGGPVAMLYGSGPAQGMPVNTDLDQQIKLLVKFQPNIIIVHAGVLTGLVTEWERTRYPLTELKHIKNVGDTVHDNLRERVRDLTGLEIEDNYSSSEVGTIAIQCPASGLFHIMSENLIVEILDETGRACKAGEVGRVVVTDLENAASPIIRYDIGDYAEVGEPCTCGRHLPTLKRILGRERGLFVRADGSRFWPTAGQRRIEKVVPMRQWQMIQHSLTDIEYRMVTDNPLTEEQHSKLTEIVNDNLGFTNEVRVVRYADSLPLFNGKYEESVCLVK